MAVEWSFTPGDVARLRFAFSPMWEVVASLRAVQGAALHPAHLPWLRELRDRLTSLGLGELTGLVPGTGYVPDFLTPTPDTHQPDFADELALVRAADPGVAQAEVRQVGGLVGPGWPRGSRRTPPVRSRWTGDALEAYWTLVFQEFWPKVRGVLEADVLYRSRRLTEGGVRDLFAALHPSVTWHGDRLIADKECIHLGELGGAGLVLLPSVFQRLDRVSIMHEPYRPMLIYPARGMGNLWGREPGGGARRAVGPDRADPGPHPDRPGEPGVDVGAGQGDGADAGGGLAAPDRAVGRRAGVPAAARARGLLPADRDRRRPGGRA